MTATQIRNAIFRSLSHEILAKVKVMGRFRSLLNKKKNATENENFTHTGQSFCHELEIEPG